MENTVTTIETLFEKAEVFTKTSLELLKLNAISKSSDILASLAVKLVSATMVATFFLFLNIGLAFWVGELLGKSYYGFFVIAGFYAFIGIIFNIFKNSLIKEPIKNSIISEILKDDEA
ncbi:hypothetical protein [Flavobacterium sp.]|uniref:hypothetical protein n=1 Tax=Flavobacterium sp. TaxID=239 RepID=UPI00286D4EBB|nr:hypothetical protein [Flavobacterium sp.]